MALESPPLLSAEEQISTLLALARREAYAAGWRAGLSRLQSRLAEMQMDSVPQPVCADLKRLRAYYSALMDGLLATKGPEEP